MKLNKLWQFIERHDMSENDKCDDVEYRKIQERVANMIAGGFHKEIAKTAKALYDAYVEVGFEEEQALDLVKITIRPY